MNRVSTHRKPNNTPRLPFKNSFCWEKKYKTYWINLCVLFSFKVLKSEFPSFTFNVWSISETMTSFSSISWWNYFLPTGRKASENSQNELTKGVHATKSCFLQVCAKNKKCFAPLHTHTTHSTWVSTKDCDSGLCLKMDHNSDDVWIRLVSIGS